jgi:hypothetical protein
LKKEIHKNRNLLTGILLTIFAAGILSIAGFFLSAKYSQPPSLAKLLPNEETLLFGELRLDAETPRLSQVFAGIPSGNILEMENFELTNPEELLAFAQNRIGVAFFGENLDPRSFALILDFVEQKDVLAFFEQQALDGEELQTQNFLHQKIYFYPRSRNLVFMFSGRDLILASDMKVLQKIATAIHIPEKRISDGAAFRKTIAKLNPKENFIFFSPQFIDAFFENRFAGIGKAFATPLLNLWEGGGINFGEQRNGLGVQVQFVLKNNFARNPLFLEVENLDFEMLNLLGEETQTFLTSKNLNSQLVHFLEVNKSLDSPLSAITTSWLEKNIKEWLGNDFGVDDFAQLFESTSTVGISATGGVLGIFEGEFDELIEKLEGASGRLAAAESLVELPDTTPGHELSVEEEVEIKEDLFASHRITRLKFPNHELNFVKLDNLLVFSSEREVLEKMIARFVAEEKVFGSLIEESGVEGGNIFYTRIEDSEVPLLRPFRFAISGLDFEADNVKINIFLGK